MLKAAEYRLYARKCRASAEQISSADGRERLLNIAVEWERLAATHERRLAPPRSTSGKTDATEH